MAILMWSHHDTAASLGRKSNEPEMSKEEETKPAMALHQTKEDGQWPEQRKGVDASQKC